MLESKKGVSMTLNININLVPNVSTEGITPEEASRTISEAVNALFQRWAEEESRVEEQHWDELFGKSLDVLTRLANEARAERKAGRTKELNPDLL